MISRCSTWTLWTIDNLRMLDLEVRKACTNTTWHITASDRLAVIISALNITNYSRLSTFKLDRAYDNFANWTERCVAHCVKTCTDYQNRKPRGRIRLFAALTNKRSDPMPVDSDLYAWKPSADRPCSWNHLRIYTWKVSTDVCTHGPAG